MDGSYGEGGGQILRTAVAFSIALQRPIRVTNIRAGREVPGLRQQHASALEILRDVSRARLEGCHVGSTEIAFVPGTGGGGRLSFDMKTAASITLVLQAVVPAVALSRRELVLDLVGGTDVPWSPTFDYCVTVLRRGFAMIGIKFDAKASTRGYYPRGGGRVNVVVEACEEPKPLSLVDPGAKPKATVLSRCGSLPEHVARRQLESSVATLSSRGVAVGETISSLERSSSPGSSVLVYDTTGGRVAGSDAIGARGKAAELVGSQAAETFADTLDSGACIDSNLADMVAPVLAMAKGESHLRIPAPTAHLDTSLHVAEIFTGCDYRVDRQGSSSLLTITPHADRR
ncbi:MAG: RNA 3'-terminal phosphate cyclase [Nitrososphaerales archaeon]|nr:RNA 3'-terminal phosphate cyclase [Nitrososphaerales archaeon]